MAIGRSYSVSSRDWLGRAYDVRLFQPGSIGLTDAKGIGQAFEKENDNVIAFGRKEWRYKQEQSLNSLIDRLLLILKVYTPIDWSIATARLWERILALRLRASL